MKREPMLNTVKKVGPVLDLFTAEQSEWRMTDIARALEMPKSSAHALVTTLADVGLLSVGPSGRYRLRRTPARPGPGPAAGGPVRPLPARLEPAQPRRANAREPGPQRRCHAGDAGTRRR